MNTLSFFTISILGIVQGLTEFLPVSSSGHLVLLSHLFQLNEVLSVSVAMHFGSLCALFVFYRKDLYSLCISDTASKKIDTLKLYLIAVAPAGLCGLFFESYFQSFFDDISILPLCFLISAAFLYATKFKTHTADMIHHKEAIIIGLAQVMALLPGVSRSGITISVAIFLNVSRKNAADFSFLMSIPMILGALLLESPSLSQLGKSDFTIILSGIALAFISGLLALKILYHMFNTRISFHMFAYYCVFMALFSFLKAYPH